MPATYTYPGVYIEEISSGVHTITGVATSIAAFVGWAPQGPVDEATLVQSWPEFQTLFGGLDSRSYLGYSVNQFFANGGRQAYIVPDRLGWIRGPGSGHEPHSERYGKRGRRRTRHRRHHGRRRCDLRKHDPHGGRAGSDVHRVNAGQPTLASGGPEPATHRDRNLLGWIDDESERHRKLDFRRRGCRHCQPHGTGNCRRGRQCDRHGRVRRGDGERNRAVSAATLTAIAVTPGHLPLHWGRNNSSKPPEPTRTAHRRM